MDDGGDLMTKTNQSEWLSWLKAFIIALFLVWIIRTFLIVPIRIEGPSMKPTLSDQDFVIAEKITYYFSSPDRFDVIIFHATEKKDYIKRVIGLPGETVAYENDQLYINDQLIEEPFLTDNTTQQSSETPFTQDFNLLEGIPGQHQFIPEGYYLVLGDNRQDSTDSRSNSIGLISEDEIVGKARFIYWPVKQAGLVH